jgi:hypothetical protein
MTIGISQISSAIDFLVNAILICYLNLEAFLKDLPNIIIMHIETGTELTLGNHYTEKKKKKVRERERDSFNFYKNPSKFQETYSLQTV